MPGNARDQQKDDMPSIPDGGLAESMPDWLRRPPAWRTLPDREVVAPAPVSTAGLPDADSSVIDPRTFIGVEDLPDWLRAFQVPVDHTSRSPSVARDEDLPIAPSDIRHEPAGHPVPQETFRPRRLEPLPVASTVTRPPTTPAPATPATVRSWWETAAFTLILGVALMLAIVVIVVMAVS